MAIFNGPVSSRGEQLNPSLESGEWAAPGRCQLTVLPSRGQEAALSIGRWLVIRLVHPRVRGRSLDRQGLEREATPTPPYRAAEGPF